MVELAGTESTPRALTVHPPSLVTVRPRAAGVPRDLGSPELPGSKSHAQRALLLAGLGAGTTRLRGVPDGDDVRVTTEAIVALGASVTSDGSDLCIDAAPALRAADIDCAHNATALRTLLVVVALLRGRARLHGSARLRQRPLADARGLLARLGAEVGEEWPLRVDGAPVPASGWLHLEVGAAATSQVASGAVLGLACRAARSLAGGEVVVRPGGVPLGYLRLTCRVAADLGFAVAWSGDPADAVRVAAPRTGRRSPYVVPVDASAATFVAALAALHDLPCGLRARDDDHPDWQGLADLDRLRATPAGSELRFADVGRRPDTFPALAAAAAAREGTTVLAGASALRHKESDRIAAMAAGLRALGVTCAETDDGLVVEGRDLHRHSAASPVHLPQVDDHRVVMALALLGTVLPAGVMLGPRSAPAKSWPGFFAWLGRCATVV